MRSIRKTAFKAFLVMLVVSSTTSIGMAQFASEATIRDTIRRIQTRTDSLQRAAQIADDRGNYRAEDFNRLILDFESAVNQLDRRLGSRRTASADARVVLDRAVLIDSVRANKRSGGGSQREWQAMRADLDILAGYYNLNTNWGTTTPGGSNDYTLNDAQIRQLVQRIDTRAAAFSRNFRQDLNRSYGNDRVSTDEARRQLMQFETELVQRSEEHTSELQSP